MSQSPAAGAKVAACSSVNLVVSSGPPPVRVPNEVGVKQAAATSAIGKAGLAIGTITQQTSATAAAGIVISESPAAGTNVVRGSKVSLIVSHGRT
jgi:serine/threonine-protein kinase